MEDWLLTFGHGAHVFVHAGDHGDMARSALCGNTGMTEPPRATVESD